MPWTDWFCNNTNGGENDPIYCPGDSYVIGGEVLEQAGPGVINLRLQFRDKTSNDEGWTAWTSSNHDKDSVIRGPVTVPFDHVVVGMAVEEQAGHGVIDFWFTYRSKSSTDDAVSTSDKFTSNSNASWHRGPISVPHGNYVAGVQVREQGGFGIIDIRLYYLPI